MFSVVFVSLALVYILALDELIVIINSNWSIIMLLGFSWFLFLNISLCLCNFLVSVLDWLVPALYIDDNTSSLDLCLDRSIFNSVVLSSSCNFCYELKLPGCLVTLYCIYFEPGIVSCFFHWPYEKEFLYIILVVSISCCSFPAITFNGSTGLMIIYPFSCSFLYVSQLSSWFINNHLQSILIHSSSSFICLCLADSLLFGWVVGGLVCLWETGLIKTKTMLNPVSVYGGRRSHL